MRKSFLAFTIVEIVVATAVFAIVTSSLFALFNYVLKINRRSEALRQTSQGMRNMVEFLVKEIRNGQVNYGYVDPDGSVQSSLPEPCLTQLSDVDPSDAPGYDASDNLLGLLDTENNEVCVYYAKSDNTYIGTGNFTSAQAGVNLIYQKGSLAPQVLNPPNFKIQQLKFLVRPLKDPYYSGNLKRQPSVTMLMHFVVTLPTGEQVPIFYQTSVTSNQYDIPN